MRNRLVRALVCALLVGSVAPAAARADSSAPVTHFGKGDVFASGLALVESSTATAVVVSSSTDVGNAAVASTYAHRYRLPLVLVSPSSSASTLARALLRRAAKAIVVGSANAVPSSLDRALQAKGVRVVRIGGVDRNATAALIATRIRPAESSTAVYVSLSGDPVLIALAAAFANARGLPLLPIGATVPKATLAAVSSLHLSGGVAIGDSGNVSDAAIARIPDVTRVIGRDVASTSFALVRSLPAGAPTLLLDAAAQPSPLATIARSPAGEPLLLVGGGALPTAQQAWLAARGDITAVAATPAAPAATVTAASALIANRGAIGALPALQMKPSSPVTVPAQFTLSGSGFGHGVGMSQWGAYGMAVESHTATDILQHYFTGSVVSPVSDTSDVNVSLESRVPSASFRLDQLADATSKLEMTAANGTVTLLNVGDVVTTKYNAGSIAVSVSGSTPVPAFTTTSITLKWAGNRDTGTATGGPALLRVAGPGVSVASGGRYRYGTVLVTVAKLSGALTPGLQVNNVLRLHDEYLYGIAEVSSSWPAAAIQAQIITARSYAYRKVKAGLRSACSCNVYDDTRDQMFTGYAKLAEPMGARWKAAVDGTAASPTQGLMLTVAGQVVSAYYSAADGGRTQNNEDVWGGAPLSYTRSVDDPWSLKYATSSVSRWVPRSFSQAQMAQAFGAPDVAYLDLSDRYASGAVNNAVAVSSNGMRYPLGAETLKARLNNGLSDAEVLSRGIPSVWMWRVDAEVPTTTPAAASLQVSAGNTAINAKLASTTSNTVVVAQSDTSTEGTATLALAAAFAGAQHAGLLVNASQVLDGALKADLTRRRATQVVFVGAVPPALVAGVNALRIGIVRYTAGSPAALSAQLAAATVAPIGTPVVLVSQSDTTSLAIAVSLSARAHAPLLMVAGGVFAPEVSAYLLRLQPASSVVVGSADAVPDATVAGIGTTTRLTTGDAPLASLIAASQVSDTATSAIAIAATSAPTWATIIAASTGLALYLVNAPMPMPSATPSPIATSAETSTPSLATPAPTATVVLPDEVLALAVRQPALTLVLRVGLDATSVVPLRNA